MGDKNNTKEVTLESLATKVNELETANTASSEKIAELETANTASSEKVVALEKANKTLSGENTNRDNKIKNLQSAAKKSTATSISTEKKEVKKPVVPKSTMTVEIDDKEVEVKFNLATFNLKNVMHLSADIVKNGNKEVVAELIEMGSSVISIVE